MQLSYKYLPLQSAETITQWTKRVVIERQRAHFDPEAPIVAPVIRIERQSSQAGSGNKAANAASVRQVFIPSF